MPACGVRLAAVDFCRSAAGKSRAWWGLTPPTPDPFRGVQSFQEGVQPRHGIEKTSELNAIAGGHHGEGAIGRLPSRHAPTAANGRASD
jgi:hypothetical protein